MKKVASYSTERSAKRFEPIPVSKFNSTDRRSKTRLADLGLGLFLFFLFLVPFFRPRRNDVQCCVYIYRSVARFVSPRFIRREFINRIRSAIIEVSSKQKGL